jgi:acetolactate synthase-1/2/3 large subunit
MAALHHAASPVPGPVHISIPADLLTLPILEMDEQNLESHSPFGLIDHQPGLPHEDVLAALQLTLDHCRQGTLLIGNGCEGAMQHILLFAETRQWPIVSTPMGRGLISSNNPLYKGVFGIAGHESARQAMQGDADNLILFIGSDINQYTTCNWDGSTVLDNQLPDRLIHIDANSDYLARSGSARMQILASPEQLFKHLNEQSLPIPEVSDSEPFCSNRHLDRSQKLSLLHLSECLSHHTPINPRHLFWYLSQHAPDNSRVHIDSGTLSYWAIHYWHQHYRHDLNQNLLRLSLGFSTPGWSIGSAIGAAIANGDAPIIAIFNSEDFAARAADLARMKQRGNHLLLIAISTTSEPSINFEVDDRDELQTYEFDISPICPLKPMALAEAIGIPALSITSSALLEDIPLKSLLSKGGPRLLEIMIDGTIAPPIGQATNSAT